MGSPTHTGVQSRSHPSLNEFKDGILKGDRVILSRAITLVESSLDSDRALASDLIQRLLPHTGKSIRIGITGSPGVGKSTFIEAFGKYIISQDMEVAVLAIDPSSKQSRGSILGDKTRMDTLSKNEHAFIRPTSAGAALGGVADTTRESILLCEAAGFDVVIVETVGVGQSEVGVRSMVDFFLLLMLGGAGDDLQGIKRGIMEMADGLVITKADGDSIKKSKQAQADFKHALHLFPPSLSGWSPKVLITSAKEGTGIEEVWKMIDDFHSFTRANGFFEKRRKEQNIEWFHTSIENIIKHEISRSPLLKKKMGHFEREIEAGKIVPRKAAQELATEFLKHLATS